MAQPYIINVPAPTNIPAPPSNIPGLLGFAGGGIGPDDWFCIPAGPPPATATAASPAVTISNPVSRASSIHSFNPPGSFVIPASSAASTVGAASPPGSFIIPAAPPAVPKWMLDPPMPGKWPADPPPPHGSFIIPANPPKEAAPPGMVIWGEPQREEKKPVWYVIPHGSDGTRGGKKPLAIWKFE